MVFLLVDKYVGEKNTSETRISSSTYFQVISQILSDNNSFNILQWVNFTTESTRGSLSMPNMHYIVFGAYIKYVSCKSLVKIKEFISSIRKNFVVKGVGRAV